MRETVQGDWPGDLAGRLLLSLARHARAGMPTLERAVALNGAMLAALQPQGYFGPELGPVLHEQQVACHGWVVSGLLQHYYVTGDERSRAAALRVVDDLLVPAMSHIASYPRRQSGGGDPPTGGASGSATRVLGEWLVSTDTWCVLLGLNGLVPAAIETNREDLRDLISLVTDLLSEVDLTTAGAQLHAVLGASRNLADYAESHSDDRARTVAARLYGSYRAAGRTLNYATYNWFGHPESWTEPCAIVDSLGAAHALHRLTGADGYRRDAVRIARNGLGFAERKDGSFGLDSIATAITPVLRPLVHDAHWCCTMRGAVGLLEARECAAQFDGATGELHLTDFYPGTHLLAMADGTRWQVRVDTGYPAADRLHLVVESCPAAARPLAVTIVAWGAGAPQIVLLPPSPGAGAEVVVAMPHSVTEQTAGGAVQEFQGPILMVRASAQPHSGERTGLHRISAVAGGFGPLDHPEFLLTHPPGAVGGLRQVGESDADVARQ